MATFLTLLGAPRVEHDGAMLALPPERGCRLLALLALRRGWVPRSELAALFWPRQRGDLAAANLRKALHFARAVPWAGGLEAQAGALRFVVATDVHEFERDRREGRIPDAVERCRGELLDGMDDPSNPAWTEWLDAERAEHARRWHELTRIRLGQLAAAPAQAATFATRLLEADPLDEDAIVALLAAQHASGRLDQQRETYRSYAVRLDEELGVEPSLRVRRMIEEAAPRDGRQRPDAAAPDDGFFGRTSELRELSALLERPGCRLLTLTGPGGIGKSSLLKRALRHLAPQYADGGHWIALDDLQDTAQVAARIAAELKLAPSAQQPPLPLVCSHLSSRQVLLVLDNGEHLGELARLVERLLEAAPRLRVCVSSRVRLRAQGEWLLALGGLGLPAPGAPTAELLASDAARLFVAAASAIRPGFDARGQAATIGTLVRATGGLPLAILLAAHWARLLPVAEIVQELAASLDVLDSGDAEGEERPEHRSVRSTFERSWQILATREQRALAALSVFVGSFSRQAAYEVAGAALPLLATLTDKSLLQMPEGGRCALHPLIRQFAVEKLGAEGLAAAARRHADWFMRRLARLGLSAEKGDPRSLDDIDADLENCRQAWRWSVAHGDAEALAAGAIVLMRFFELRGRALEGLALLEEARAAIGGEPMPPAACAANLSASIAHLQFRLHRLDEAAATARLGLGHARAAGSGSARALCLNVLALCHYQRGRHAEAKRLLEQAIRQARAGNDIRTGSAAQTNLAMIEKELGNYAEAERSMREVLAQQRQWGDWVRVASLLNNLAALHEARGEWQAARACLDEGIEISDRHGIAQVLPHLLVNLAVVRYFCGDDLEAERVSLRALEAARAMANRGAEASALINLVRLALRRGDAATARVHLQQAVAGPSTLSNQLDCVLAFARIRALEGAAAAAAPLLRYFLARPEIEPADRDDAEACLAGLPPGAADAAPSPLDLDALVQRIAEDVAPARAPA